MVDFCGPCALGGIKCSHLSSLTNGIFTELRYDEHYISSNIVQIRNGRLLGGVSDDITHIYCGDNTRLLRFANCRVLHLDFQGLLLKPDALRTLIPPKAHGPQKSTIICMIHRIPRKRTAINCCDKLWSLHRLMQDPRPRPTHAMGVANFATCETQPPPARRIAHKCCVLMATQLCGSPASQHCSTTPRDSGETSNKAPSAWSSIPSSSTPSPRRASRSRTRQTSSQPT
jgi:hypothetical protein